MKKGKFLSLFLSAVMATQLIPAAAEPAEYVSVSMNPADFATNARTYYIAGQTGFFGSSTKNARSVARDGFMNMEGLWKNEWSEIEKTWVSGQNGFKQDNILTLNGIDYNVRVTYEDLHSSDSSVPAGTTPGDKPGNTVKSNLRTFEIAGDETKNIPFYKTFDVEDGYYKGISFLGGKDSWGGMPYVRYNYTDGTKSNWVQLGVNKKVTEEPSETEVCLAVPGMSWDDETSEEKYTDADGSDLKIYLYQINEMSVDSDKMLDSFDIIARNGKITEGTSDDPVRYYNSEGEVNNYAYTALFLGITLLSDEECIANAKLTGLKEILAQLPPVENFEATDENVELLKRLFDIYGEINPDAIKSEEGIEIYYSAMDYLEYREDVQDVFAGVPYTSFVNAFRAYYNSLSASGNGNTFSNQGINSDKFKAPEAGAGYLWKNAWGEEDIHNTLVFNGYEYDVAVVPSSDADTYVTFQAQTRATNGNKNYYTIDIADGYYNEISFLGGLEYNGSAAAVRLNYSDGTDSGFITIKASDGSDVKKFNARGVEGEYIALSAFSGSTGNNNYTERTLYMHQYKVSVDSGKILTSVDFPARDAVIDNGQLTDSVSGTAYNVRWFGIGLKTNGILVKDSKIISVKVDPDLFVNNERTYNSNVYSGYGNGIYKETFLQLPNWLTVPDTAASKYSDGIFTVNDVDYTLRVNNEWGQYTSYTSKSSENYYITIDIPDGYYTAASFLGGGKGYRDDGVSYIRFNYKGGGTSGWIKYTQPKVTAAGGIAVDKCDNTGAKVDGNLYVHQITVLCDMEKIIDTVDLIASNGDVVNGEAGEVTTQLHGSTYLGMTMLTNRRVQNQDTADDSKEPICLFISPEGDDNNEGTLENPLKTLGAAVEKAKEIDALSTYERDVIITMADGEYEIFNTVNIAGLRGNVTIQAKEGEAPVIKGSRTVNIADMGDYEGINGVKKINLADYAIYASADSILTQNTSTTSTYTFGVFSDNSINPIAEYPNNGSLVIESAINTTEGETISIENENFLYYNDENLVVEGYFAEPYRSYKTTDFTIDGSVLTLNTLKSRKMYGLNRNWRMFNSLALLDTEGEWYLDKSDETLYYMPRDGESVIEISNMTDALLNVNMDNVSIKGLTFKDTCGDAIVFRNTSGSAVYECTFREIGRTALRAENSRNMSVKNNIIENTGYMGVNVSGGNVNTLEESGNIIENNRIIKPGRTVRCYAHGVNVSGVGNVVKNNYIADSKSILVGFSGSLNKIIYNDIRDAGSEAADLGAIYAGRNLTYLGNEIAYNHIINAERNDGSMVCGVYLDDGLSGTNVHHNIIENASRGVFTNGGALNNVDNNVFVNCTDRAIVLGSNPISGFTIDNKTLTQYAADFFSENSAYAERFTSEYLEPLTVDVNSFVPAGVSAQNNRFINCAADISNSADAEISGNEEASSLMEGIAKADIDINKIGLIKSGLDSTVAYAVINNGRAIVNFVSTYDEFMVIAALRDSQGRLIGVFEAEDGAEFPAAEGAAAIDIYVWNGLDYMTPVTK